jgi:hypothetical protein
MPKYNEDFDPPAPWGQVAVRHPQTGQEVTKVPVQLDTGANITLLPKVFVEQLGVSVLTGETQELIGFNGAVTMSPIVYLQLVFAGKRVTGEFCLVEQGYGILGRDVLNEVKLMLDGPSLTWSRQS